MIRIIRSYQRFNTYYKESKTTFKKCFNANRPTIILDASRTYQTHMGFGGAFTEAAAVTFDLASKEQQNEIMDAYYGENGHKYNLGRTVIHSSDFSESTRFYIGENDKNLDNFDMSADDEQIVPMIKEAQKRYKDLWLLSSVWSPLPFMKSNQDAYYGGQLLPEYDQMYAKYFVKYFEEMAKRGIPIQATTIQNEPEAVQVWESCEFSAKDELRFAKVLSHALEEAKMDVKIVVWDHNRDHVFERTHEILKEIPEKIWGVGYHWYMTEDSQNLSMVHDAYPDHHILFTEGCVEYTNTALNSGGSKDDQWKNAEFYARNIIKDSLNYSEAFIDWNLLLNEEGGPNHVGNYCEAPLMYDRELKKIIYNPSYYFIGHFSRYIDIGAKRIHINQTANQEVFATAYQNLNKDVVLIILNQGWVNTYNVIIGKKTLELSLPDRSITTLVIDAEDLED